MSEFALILTIVASGAVIILSLLAAVFFFVRKQLAAMQEQQREILQQMITTQQQQQNDLLAIGQRVLEADKLVRRFSDRIDAIENAEPTKTQYGQLESLLSKAIENEGDASSAETELLALLRQQQRRG
ncbi:MAG: hypothetical protein JWM78_3066 [Verrucomicrobiaceae bacterium]|nr:hypothetical protein [Verrucomicrobiaceae bacterium]